MKTQKILAIFAIFLVLTFSTLVSSLTLENVQSSVLYPSQSTQVTITVKNNLNDDAKQVSLALILEKTQISSLSGQTATVSGTPFITIGSSEISIDKIKEGSDEEFIFVLKASNDIRPGNYNIPYVLSYEVNEQPSQKAGTFGVTVSAKTELSFSAETENNIQKQKGKISLKIINNGLGDIRFVSVKLSPSGYTLFSADQVYIGAINSDDFETATFEVLFTGTNAKLNAEVSYKDFDNIGRTEDIRIPIKIYTKEKALELGLIKNSYTGLYILVLVVLVVFWIIYRRVKKRRRLNNLKK